ncbi:alpha-tocopherol transfer protein [Halyomorpha halys]|uniref:alpha-tocopherol transfer protein n=1 Tax=Halyomorpha halys TaxID=286706 RepID=UPI0006D4F86D|nr:alpha-tocopherol transfer protein-like [Halyomorpha halys]
MTKCLVPLSEEQYQKTLENIGYSSETFQSHIEDFRKWALEQKQLPETKKDEPDSFYEVILVGCKGNLDLSKQKLKAYYYSRTKYPILFNKKDPLDESIMNTADTILIATLPKPTPEGSRVTMMSANDTDPKKYDLLTGVLRLFLLIELRGREEGVFNKEWVIFDAQNITMGHIFRILMPSVVKNVLEYIQTVLNARIKGIIVINAPRFIEKTINNFIKPLLKKKIAQRVFLYSEGKSALWDHFPQKILPKEYGGEEESLKNLSDMWLNKGKSEKEWLVKVLTEKIEERKDEKPKGSYFSSTLKFFSMD